MNLERLLYNVQKPGRYTGRELNSVIKDKNAVDVRFAFCFPDVYEVGMSHLGMKILYALLNEQEGVWCERVFAPWVDMEEQMRAHQVPLFALESGDPLDAFDMVGFTLQYELSYSNLVHMLKLGNIPLYAKDRSELSPLVIAGGPCAYNCEPIADFLDLVVLGEGEEINVTLVELYRQHKKKGSTKQEFLEAAARLPGIYIPSFYDVDYDAAGRVAAIRPNNPAAPEKVRKVIIEDLSKAYYPDKFVVPSIETIHDRVMLELFRGCIRGCRFCQAGMIYRPVREKPAELLNDCAKKLYETSGYEEISLSSLSTSDYTGLNPLIENLLSWTEEKKVNLALPSLRVDKFDKDLVLKIQKVRKSGLTFAPEAGSQRMRDVINKNVLEEDVLKTARIAFENGYATMKLYFMIGLPTETDEDIDAIADLAFRVLDVYREVGSKKLRPSVTVSVSSFVPKPFTPFQWEGQDTREMLDHKQARLREKLRTRRVALHWHDVNTSFLEGVFARGDRRLARVLELAVDRGCKFDGWDEFFDLDKYLAVMDELGLDPAFYANRERREDEVLPWDHIDVGVTKPFLLRERKRAYEGKTTPNCRQACAGCGIGCKGAV